MPVQALTAGARTGLCELRRPAAATTPARPAASFPFPCQLLVASSFFLFFRQNEFAGRKYSSHGRGHIALVFLHQKQKLCILFSFVGTAIIRSVHPTKSATASSQSAVFFSDNKLAPATSYQPQPTKQSELYTVSTHPYTTHTKNFLCNGWRILLRVGSGL